MKIIVFVDEVEVGDGRKRGIEDFFKVFVLSYWVDGILIIVVGKSRNSLG